ncbi:hypothetical protein ACTPEM_26430, partial [Clostridioides difficile]
QITQLKNLLSNTGYNLLIPYKYLTARDIEGIVTLINTGSIELRNEEGRTLILKEAFILGDRGSIILLNTKDINMEKKSIREIA